MHGSAKAAPRDLIVGSTLSEKGLLFSNNTPS